MVADLWDPTTFAIKKCAHCCERPEVGNPCAPVNVCEPVHAVRDYEPGNWRLWFKYAAYAVLGVGGSLGAFTCWTKLRQRRRRLDGDDEKDNWEEEEDEEEDARNRDNNEN